MAGKSGSIEEILKYLPNCRSLNKETKDLAIKFFEALKGYSDWNARRPCGVNVLTENSCYLYFYGEHGQYCFVYDKSTGLKLDYAPNGERNRAVEFVVEWEKHTKDESSQSMIEQMVGGLDEVIAFQNGKAYQISMREVGAVDIKKYVQDHVEQGLQRVQDSYQQTIESLNSNMERERQRYVREIENLKRQSLGDIDINWDDVLKGKFFMYKLGGYGEDIGGLAARVEPTISRVQPRLDGETYWLKKPFKMPTAVIFKSKQGGWYVLPEGYPEIESYTHPHVEEGSGVLCLGNMGNAVGGVLRSSSQFLSEVPQVVSLLGTVNWRSPYQTDFDDSGEGQLFNLLKEFDNEYNDVDGNISDTGWTLADYGLQRKSKEKGIITL